jgi:hypothetical protein
MGSSIFTFKVVRSCALGFCICSPKLNGLYIEFYFLCFHFCINGRGQNLMGFFNFWDA